MRLVAKPELSLIRVKKGYTKKSLSEAVNKHKLYIGALEKGTPCSPDSAREIADKLEVRIEDIFFIK